MKQKNERPVLSIALAEQALSLQRRFAAKEIEHVCDAIITIYGKTPENIVFVADGISEQHIEFVNEFCSFLQTRGFSILFALQINKLNETELNLAKKTESFFFYYPLKNGPVETFGFSLSDADKPANNNVFSSEKVTFPTTHKNCSVFLVNTPVNQFNYARFIKSFDFKIHLFDKENDSKKRKENLRIFCQNFNIPFELTVLLHNNDASK